MVINTQADLKVAILKLEEEKIRQKENLVLEVNRLKENLKPINLLKNSLQQVTEPGVGKKILGVSALIGASVLSKKLAKISSRKIAGNLLGAVIKTAATGIAIKSGQTIKKGIGNIFRKLSRKHNHNGIQEV